MERNRCEYRDTSQGGTARCRNPNMTCCVCQHGDGVVYPLQEDCEGFEGDEEGAENLCKITECAMNVDGFCLADRTEFDFEHEDCNVEHAHELVQAPPGTTIVFRKDEKKEE